MTDLTLDLLLAACSPGGASCLTYTTELTSSGGPHTSVAPAKFVSGDNAVYAYERRFLDGEPRDAVVLDSKQSLGNRLEQQLALAVEQGAGPLARLPHMVLTYGDSDVLTDLTAPHRAFDGHFRAGSIDGVPATQTEAYRAVRDASPVDARALLAASPVTLLLGGWDSSRRSKQGRWRSLLVGEIMGFLPGPSDGSPPPAAARGGARVDPFGARVQLDAATVKQLVADQRDELSENLVAKLTKAGDAAAKSKKPVPGSALGLGGIPPVLEQLGGVSCDRIIRTRVLSFAGLRQIRFGAGTDADLASRALLSALALAGIARADAELDLRANCDLREAGQITASLDQRGGDLLDVRPPTIAESDDLLTQALAHAEQAAGITWNGATLRFVGNPSIPRGARDDADEEPGS